MIEHIYNILSSKPHNKHFLSKYIRFIENCEESNKTIDESCYTEIHHVCPKANDLFPEYKNLEDFPWNKAVLTARQHYIAHQMLMKIYGGSQTYAFVAMNRQARKSSKQKNRYTKTNSTFYQNAKKEVKRLQSIANKGFSAYTDSLGNTIRCKTDDPRVLSGELVSKTKGRIHKKHTPEKSKERRRHFQELFKNVPKYRYMYFLDMKVKINIKEQIFVELYDQGWRLNRTKESKSRDSTNLNFSKFDNKIQKLLQECDYSRYRILYDIDQDCFLSGDPVFWTRPGKNVKKITSNKEFKPFKDKLTGVRYQVSNDIQTPFWFEPYNNRKI